MSLLYLLYLIVLVLICAAIFGGFQGQARFGYYSFSPLVVILIVLLLLVIAGVIP